MKPRRAYPETLKPRSPDLTGQRFGRLTVIGRVHVKRGTNNVRSGWLWMCLCDCGTKTLTYPHDLNRSSTKRRKVSCGCYNKDIRSRPYGEAALDSLFERYRREVVKRNLGYSLDKAIFQKLTQSTCYYCQQPPDKVHGSDRFNGGYLYNGLDRVDNSIGYIPDNVVSCCYICNRGKSTLSQAEWINHCKRVAATHS